MIRLRLEEWRADLGRVRHADVNVDEHSRIGILFDQVTVQAVTVCYNDGSTKTWTRPDPDE